VIKLFLGWWKYITDSQEKEFRQDLKQIIGSYPIELSYYKIAFIHKSASYIDHEGKVVNNERLEFLGDAILGAVIGDYLFRLFPEANEGFLTQARSKLVNRKILSSLANKIGINQFIITHIKRFKINKHIPGNALEAFIGAVYLDLGYNITKKFIISRLFHKNVDVIRVINSENNYKSRILEWAQHSNVDVNFNTHQIDNHMPARFESEIFLNSQLYGKGIGESKKEAEQEAARQAFLKVDNGQLPDKNNSSSHKTNHSISS
jgi:ribonuclease-3